MVTLVAYPRVWLSDTTHPGVSPYLHQTKMYLLRDYRPTLGVVGRLLNLVYLFLSPFAHFFAVNTKLSRVVRARLAGQQEQDGLIFRFFRSFLRKKRFGNSEGFSRLTVRRISPPTCVDYVYSTTAREPELPMLLHRFPRSCGLSNESINIRCGGHPSRTTSTLGQEHARKQTYANVDYTGNEEVTTAKLEAPFFGIVRPSFTRQSISDERLCICAKKAIRRRWRE